MASIDSNTFFELRSVIHSGDVSAFLAAMRGTAARIAWPPVIGFASPIPTTPKLPSSKLRDFASIIEELDHIAQDPGQVIVGFSKTSTLSWGGRPDGKTISLIVSFSPLDSVFEVPSRCITTLSDLVRELLKAELPISGAVERLGDLGACVPLVPLAKTRRPLVITTDAEVETEYARPEEFWSAGWTIERFGDRSLLTRCQAAVTPAEVLRETQDSQWQMARAARSRRTAYGHPTVTDEERQIYEQGDARAVPVGRDAKTGLVEYSCVLQPGDHLRGFEIFYLRSLVADKRMQDGTPVSAVRVVFLKEWMAESEKRPLLDVGVEVYYDNHETDELVRVE